MGMSVGTGEKFGSTNGRWALDVVSRSLTGFTVVIRSAVARSWSRSSSRTAHRRSDVEPATGESTRAAERSDVDAPAPHAPRPNFTSSFIQCTEDDLRDLAFTLASICAAAVASQGSRERPSGTAD
jgi:hypothetical protein